MNGRSTQLTIASVLFLTFISSTTQEFDYCNQKCHNGNVNSMCNNDCANKLCNAVEVTDEFRQTMLDSHNAIRNDVALGKIKKGKLSTAADMQVMQYDKELEVAVKCNIVKVGFNHDECRGSEHFFPQGQNLHKKNSSRNKAVPINELGKHAVQKWFDEVTLITNATIYDHFASVHGAGHYTQVIWAKSYIIGCSVCEYEEDQRKIVVLGCNYYKQGNVKNQPIFKKGTPASECGDLKPNSEYPGLCGETKSIDPHAHHKMNSNNINRSEILTLIYCVMFIIIS